MTQSAAMRGNDTIDGGAGRDTLIGNSGDDIIDGGEGEDRLLGGFGNDVLSGGTENDILNGFNGDDSLKGGEGDDRLLGGTGNDTIGGDTGRDIMAGGDGNDRFTFDSGADSSADRLLRDRITDFVSGVDRIDLSAIDAISGGTDDAFVLVNVFTGQAGEIILRSNGTNSSFSLDLDGDRSADFSVLLVGTVSLQSTDFIF